MRVAVMLTALFLLALAGCRDTGGPETDFPEFGPGFERLAEEACTADGGTWRPGGAAGTMTCFRDTGEGTKGCAMASDCKGLCLARSRTCAPVTPLFGCNDVLGSDGRRSTLCID